MKRITASSVSWQKLADNLTQEHSTELARLKGQNTAFSSQVSQLPADLPKIDFDGLKKRMPRHETLLDSLKKQYDSIAISYGSIPDTHNKEIEDWVKYNDLRSKFQEQKLADGAIEANRVEEKWAKAPPFEHMTKEHGVQYFSKYFPNRFYDLRTDHHRLFDSLGVYGLNTEEAKKRTIWESKGYRDRRPPSMTYDQAYGH